MKYWVGLGLLLAAGVALSGCTRTPAAAPATNPSPSSPSPTPTTPLQIGTPGSDGLTVRYQGPDGRTKTLRVEDFRR